jgi:hypothetical protein
MGTFIYPCERCREAFAGDPYRVISETDGERLLDMIVCYGCYLEASQLGLNTETIPLHELVLH